MDNTNINIINAEAYKEIDREIERLEEMIKNNSEELKYNRAESRIQALLWAKRIFYPEW